MAEVFRIDDDVIDADTFVKLLKLTGRFESLIEDLVKEKLTSHAAMRQKVTLTDDEIQERADQLRRVRGLHRAADMNRYLDNLGVTPGTLPALSCLRARALHRPLSQQTCSREKKSTRPIARSATAAMARERFPGHPISRVDRACCSRTSPFITGSNPAKMPCRHSRASSILTRYLVSSPT